MFSLSNASEFGETAYNNMLIHRVFVSSRDHFFDEKERKRTKQRKSRRVDIGGLHETQTGERGVREHHRPVKSKILPTDILGITM